MMLIYDTKKQADDMADWFRGGAGACAAEVISVIYRGAKRWQVIL